MKNDAAVAIGTFDGFHRGHQSLVRALLAVARRRRLRSILVALERPVRAVPGLLSTPDEKRELLSGLPLDELIILPVTDDLIHQPAIAFLTDFLAGSLRARHVVVGANFAFGRARHGNVAWLKENAGDLAMRVTVVPPVQYHRAVISSSRIRTLLLRGRVAYANKLLGRFYSFSGMPVPGRRVGRTLGFPTINLACPPEKIVPRGVYICCASQDGLWEPGLINIGTRPTFKAGPAVVPELHLLDWSAPWKTRTTTVHLLRHIRNEICFKNKSEIVHQIGQDVRRARQFFHEVP